MFQDSCGYVVVSKDAQTLGERQSLTGSAAEIRGAGLTSGQTDASAWRTALTRCR